MTTAVHHCWLTDSVQLPLYQLLSKIITQWACRTVDLLNKWMFDWPTLISTVTESKIILIVTCPVSVVQWIGWLIVVSQEGYEVPAKRPFTNYWLTGLSRGAYLNDMSSCSVCYSHRLTVTDLSCQCADCVMLLGLALSQLNSSLLNDSREWYSGLHKTIKWKQSIQ